MSQAFQLPAAESPQLFLLHAEMVSNGRRVWEPSQSNLVDSVVGKLVKKYREGKLSEELSPKHLVELGGDFETFYHAGFHRSCRPLWAQQRFPQGFQSLVEEINNSLARDGFESTVEVPKTLTQLEAAQGSIVTACQKADELFEFLVSHQN